jgi:hypothetical protein
VLDSYAGSYEFGSGTAKITRKGGHLALTLPFLPRPLALLPISETEFDMPFTYGGMTFHKDEQGRVTGAHFKVGDGGGRDLKKRDERP